MTTPKVQFPLLSTWGQAMKKPILAALILLAVIFLGTTNSYPSRDVFSNFKENSEVNSNSQISNALSGMVFILECTDALVIACVCVCMCVCVCVCVCACVCVCMYVSV